MTVDENKPLDQHTLILSNERESLCLILSPTQTLAGHYGVKVESFLEMSLSLPLDSKLFKMFYLAVFEEEQSDVNCEAPLELQELATKYMLR